MVRSARFHPDFDLGGKNSVPLSRGLTLRVPARGPPVFESERPLVFAHRGGAKLAPENTMPAIDNGMALGADGLEIDVQLSADGIPVVIHDQTLDRTTDRTARFAALTAAELGGVDAGFRFELDGAASVSRPGYRRAAAR